MAEFKWNVRIAGKPCVVRCEVDGGFYILYADEERLGSFQRKLGQNAAGGLDVPVTIHGEQCRLVVWNDQPDIVVRNRLVGEKTDYLQEKAARQRSFFITGMIMAVIGAVIMLVCLILDAMVPEGSDTYMRILLGGVIMLVYGLYLMYKWRKTKESKNDVS